VVHVLADAGGVRAFHATMMLAKTVVASV
jgi:hypothetical protein